MKVTPDILIENFLKENVPISCKPISSLESLGYTKKEINKLLGGKNETVVSYGGISFIIRMLDGGYIGIMPENPLNRSDFMRALRRRY